MRNELKDWVRDVLLDSKTLSRGYFKKECIEYLIDQDQRFHTRPKEVLSLVALELWHRSFADGPANPTSGQERVPQTVAH
jgi:asparagine synthase (glutamine-hydrolysing)